MQNDDMKHKFVVLRSEVRIKADGFTIKINHSITSIEKFTLLNAGIEASV